MSTLSTMTIAPSVPVAFDCEGCRLVGSLHQPGVAAASVGVILLNQGPIDRGGSHRLYARLAARLSELGAAVLRFDARGVGESEGQWTPDEQPVPVSQVYERVQNGIWKPDALAAIDFMMNNPAGPRVRRVVLGGLCGGAVTALLTGADHAAVHGMFAIGTPVTSSAATRRIGALPDAIIQRDSTNYVRKIFRLDAWRRFFSFQTDYKTLVRVFAVQARRKLTGADGQSDGAAGANHVGKPIFDALKNAKRSGKHSLVVFGENDYLWQEFKEQMPAFFKDSRQLPFDLVTVPDANHTLTEESWERTVSDAIVNWMRPIAQSR